MFAGDELKKLESSLSSSIITGDDIDSNAANFNEIIKKSAIQAGIKLRQLKKCLKQQRLSEIKIGLMENEKKKKKIPYQKILQKIRSDPYNNSLTQEFYKLKNVQILNKEK